MKIKIKGKEYEIPVTKAVLILCFVGFIGCYFGAVMSFWLKVSFFVNGFVILYMLLGSIDRRAFSFELVHSIFLAIFFWVAPIIQRNQHFIAWGMRVSDIECVWANSLIFLWLVFFNLGQKLAGNKPFKIMQKKVEIKKPFLYTSAGITLALTFIMLLRQGIYGLITEGGNLFGSGVSSTVSSLFFHCVTAFITFTAIYSIRFWKKEKNPGRKWLWLMFLCLFCLVLTSFPTAISRYSAGSIYICVAIHLFPILKKKGLFFWAFSLGMFFMFPILDLYRDVSIGNVGFGSIVERIATLDTYFSTGNYDAYMMLIACFRYIAACGHTLGRQLLGAVLFFIPRSFWPGKPISSGAEIAHTIGLTFDNISAPLPMEAFIDFGLIGVVVFAFVIGYFLRRVDNSYWQNTDLNRNSFIDILYCYAVPFFMFLCRGSLLSTWAYLAANIAVVLVMTFVCTKWDVIFRLPRKNK